MSNKKLQKETNLGTGQRNNVLTRNIEIHLWETRCIQIEKPKLVLDRYDIKFISKLSVKRKLIQFLTQL